MANHVLRVLGAGTDMLLSADIGSVAVDGVTVFPAVVTEPPPVVVDPPPSIPPVLPAGDSPFFKPKSVTEFKNAMQDALDANVMLFLYPNTYDIDLSMQFKVRPQSDWAGGETNPNSKRTGLWAYGSQFNWTRTDGSKMLTFDASQGENGNFRLLGLSAYGNGYFRAPAASFVTLIGHSGSAMRTALVQDLTFYHFNVGVELIGEVFETKLINLDGSYCRTAGATVEHSGNEVLSNIFFINPSFRQASGAAKGIWCKGSANSVMVYNGNFISLGGFAIHGETGVKKIIGCSFENCGPNAIQIDASTFYTLISGCDGSNTGGAMKKLIASKVTDAAHFMQHGNCNVFGDVM
jgi:hypothetical protein